MSESVRRRRVGLVAALVVIAAAGSLAFHPDWRGFPLDDAYIHLVYAQNLAHGHGFCFNVGEPSIGTTSPLWTCLLAVAALVRVGDLRVAANLLSMALLVASAPLVYLLAERIIRGLGARAWEAAVLGAGAALLVVANGNFLWFALDGMETTLFVFIGLAACWAYERRGFTLLVGGLLGLLILTRPEGALLYLLLLIVHVARARRGALRDRIGILLPIVIYAAWLLYSHSITGSLLPTTFRGKTLSFIRTGWDARDISEYLRYLFGTQLWLFARPILVVVLLAPIALIYCAARWRSSRARTLLWLLAAWSVAHLAVYTVLFRFPYHYFRYLAILYAIAAIIGAAGAWVILAPLRGLRRWVLAVLPLAALAAGLPSVPDWHAVYHDNVAHVRHLHETVGRWLAVNTAPTDTIACFDVGAIKYYSGRRVVDLGGLVDPRAHRYMRGRRSRMGPYLIKQHVNIEVDLGNGLTGTDKDNGILYERALITGFTVSRAALPAPYDQLPPPHSRLMLIYRISPLSR